MILRRVHIELHAGPCDGRQLRYDRPDGQIMPAHIHAWPGYHLQSLNTLVQPPVWRYHWQHTHTGHKQPCGGSKGPCGSVGCPSRQAAT